jgi:hypothetical protein
MYSYREIQGWSAHELPDEFSRATIPYPPFEH